MATKAWRDYAELVGLLGIIASLVLLGYEIRQTRIAIVGQTYLSRASLSSDSVLALAQSDYLPQIIVKHRDSGLESLSAEERYRFALAANAAKTRMDAYYLQYEYGLLGEEWYQYRFVPSVRNWRDKWQELGMIRTQNTRPAFLEAIRAVPESSDS